MAQTRFERDVFLGAIEGERLVVLGAQRARMGMPGAKRDAANLLLARWRRRRLQWSIAE